MARWVGWMLRMLEARWVVAVLAVLGLALYVTWAIVKTDYGRAACDFYVYYTAAAAFGMGDNAYLLDEQQFTALAQRLNCPSYQYPYYYPPLTAFLAWPMTFLRPQVAAMIWVSLSGVALVASGIILGSSTRHRWGPALGLVLVIGFTPALLTLNIGQVNAFLLLAISAAYYLGSKGHWRMSGAFLGIGFMLKVIPIALVGYLGWQRRWSALTASLAAVAASYLLSMALTGPIHPGALGSIGSNRILNPHGANQALSGWVARNLPEGAYRIRIWIFMVGTVILATVLLCSRRPTPPARFKLEFSLILCAITMVMPYTWRHQFVVLVIPAFALLELSFTDTTKLRLALPVVVAYGLCTISNVRTLHAQWLFGAHLLLCVIMWALLAFLLTRPANLTGSPAPRPAGGPHGHGSL